MVPGADVVLDVRRVEALVAAQVPALGGVDVTHLATGWDHDVYLVGDVVLRFTWSGDGVTDSA